ncbi:hypothetical protein HQ524_03800 [Candidatus Uhrbacteria bacterium]|nr:hypothetical protein [Candidatus Uhrbacteria bacterium]
MKTIQSSVSTRMYIVSLAIMVFAVFSYASFLVPFADAAAPTVSSAVMTSTTISNFEIILTGTDFAKFASSATTNANATDLLGLTYNATNPTAGSITGSTTMILTFPLSTGTGKSGGTLDIAADTIQDSSSTGNALINLGDGSITDSAAPAVYAYEFKDTDYNGKIDSFNLVFTETVIGATSSMSASNLLVTSTGDFPGFSVTSDATDFLTSDSNKATLSSSLFVESTNSVTTDVGGSLAISLQGTFTLEDAGTNSITQATLAGAQTAILSVDLAAPVIEEFQYYDQDNDGKVDELQIYFSEDIVASSTIAKDNFSFTVGDFTGFGFTAGAGDLVSGTVDSLVLSSPTDVTEASVVDTGDNSGTFAASLSGTFNFDDAATNSNTQVEISGAQAQISVLDRALPIVTQAEVTGDNSLAYILNVLKFTYSEPVVVSLDAGGDADVSAGGAASSSTSTLGDMTTARTLTGIGTWALTNGGDMTTSQADSNNVTLSANGLEIMVAFNALTEAYFNAGTVGPTTSDFTPASDANDVADAAGNAVNGSQAVVAFTYSDAWDVTVPTVNKTWSCDLDVDGTVETMQVDMSEFILDGSAAAANFELDNDATNDGEEEVTGTTFNTSTLGCDGSAAADVAHDDKFTIASSAGVDGTNTAYFHIVSSALRDQAGNRAATGAALGTENDKAAPQDLVSMSAVGSSSSTVSLTWTATTSEGASFDHYEVWYGTDLSDVQNRTGTATQWTIGDDAALGTEATTITTVTGLTWSSLYFKVFALDTDSNSSTVSAVLVNKATGGVTVIDVTAPTGILVNAPNGGELLSGNSEVSVSWTSSGLSIVTVDLEYTVDGSTWTPLAAGKSPSGTYSWTVPNVQSNMAKIRVIGRDVGGANAAEDISNSNFSINAVAAPLDVVTAPVSGAMGVSPITGEPEEISEVELDNYIKSPGFSTIYYLGSDSKRHPFVSEQTYASWEAGFDNVVVVTDATLSTFKIGVTMPPKPGVELVKIQSVPNVYAVVENPEDEFRPLLRWVKSEEIAIDLYGSAWADFVIDVQPGQFSSFVIGINILNSSDVSVDRAVMQTRYGLNGILDTVDSDNDGLSDLEEARAKTDRFEPDTDHDGLWDWEEINMYSTDPLDPDSDDDLLNDGDEAFGSLTDPNRADTDSDGLSDGDEVNIGTDPMKFDTDDDGIYDREEIYEYGTNPLNHDTDGDSFLDGDEVANGFNPLGA